MVEQLEGSAAPVFGPPLFEDREIFMKLLERTFEISHTQQIQILVAVRLFARLKLAISSLLFIRQERNHRQLIITAPINQFIIYNGPLILGKIFFLALDHLLDDGVKIGVSFLR